MLLNTSKIARRLTAQTLGAASFPASKRITMAFFLLLSLVGFAWPGAAMAQAFPSRPINVIVPFGTGTGPDVTTRAYARFIERKTGATIVVTNRPGALSMLGTQAALQAPADGYTVLVTSTSSHSVAAAFSKEVKYDPIKDFAHLAVLTQVPAAIVVPTESPFRTIDDLVKHIRANPGKLTYSHASGSTWIIGAKFHKMLNLQSVAVPYKSSQESLMDLFGGRLDYMVGDSITATTPVKSGKARILLMLADEKFDLMPDVPFMKSAGFPPMEVISWTGLAAPARVPAEAKQWIRRSFAEAIADAEVRKSLVGLSTLVPPADTDAEKFVVEQFKLWTDAARDAGVTAQ